MEITSREIKLKYSQVLDSYKELEALYEEKQKHLEERTTHLDEHRRHVNTLRQSISQQDAEHMILQQTVNQLMDREDRRLNALKTVECQCDPETATVGIQTEFFIPAV
jgi:chromosome segregation ATPase